jgi:lipoate-protein ligase A
MVNEERCSDTWRLLDCSYDSAFRNLATEEALARNASSKNFRPTIRFWVNPQCVVLGRFQKPSAEVDTSVCQRSGIQIARRFTGGGTVFHDKGNLNFTIVTRPEMKSNLTGLNEAASAIILDALSGLGLEGSALFPNSIIVGTKKVSGAAAALGSGFILWHSSILVSTNIEILELVLAPSRKANVTHFVHSRWHPVTTLQDALGHSVGVDDVKSRLIKSAQEILCVKLEAGRLRTEEERWFTNLYDRKYSSPNWNQNGKYEEIQEGLG